MDKLRVGAVAVAGLRLFFSRFGMALKIAWVPLVLLVIIQVGGLALFGPSVIQTEATTSDAGDGATELPLDLESLQGFSADVGWIGLVLGLISLIVYAMLSVAWLRFSLVGDNLGGRPGLFRLGSREVKSAIAYVLLMLFVFVLAILVLFAAHGLSVAVGIPTIVTMIVFMLAVLFWMSRVMLVFPFIALDQGLGFRRAWQVGKGNSWRIFGAYVLMCLILFVIALVVGAGAAFLALLMFDPVEMLTLSIAGVVGIIANEIFGVCAVLVMIGTLAEAYRQLGGPGIGVPEATLAVFDDA